MTVEYLNNLWDWYRRADADDIAEGMLAYERYNQVMSDLAQHYGFTIGQTVATFSALSPNSDYLGNLRSAASVLRGIQLGASCDEIRTSGYNHCRDRAYAYATGDKDFLTETKGPKTRAFYQNLVDPFDRVPVCVDGHIAFAWLDERHKPIKQAVVSKRMYNEIAEGVRFIARLEGLIPNQVQAIIWFCRKRELGVIYDPQLDIFADNTDKWKTVLTVDQIRPFPLYTEVPRYTEPEDEKIKSRQLAFSI